MMANTQIKLDSCPICNQTLNSYAIKCDLCEAVYHKRCAKITQEQFRLIRCKNVNYHCTSCCEVFSFQNVSDDKFVFENSSVEDNYDLYKLIDNCSQFNFNSFKYLDYNPHDFENDIDPENNFYNNLSSKCQYYTNLQFTEKIGKVNGLSFIHFNARSLKTNFQKIKDYMLELYVKFDIIAISETWIETDLIDDFNINNYDAYHITRGIQRGGGVATRGIYTNKELSCKMVQSKSFVVENILECITVELTIKNHTNVVVSCMYRTPGSNLDTFCENRIYFK